jgi:hypothetical protein
MPTPRHGNWANVDEEPDESLDRWYPEVAFDDPEELEDDD